MYKFLLPLLLVATTTYSSPSKGKSTGSASADPSVSDLADSLRKARTNYAEDRAALADAEAAYEKAAALVAAKKLAMTAAQKRLTTSKAAVEEQETKLGVVIKKQEEDLAILKELLLNDREKKSTTRKKPLKRGSRPRTETKTDEDDKPPKTDRKEDKSQVDKPPPNYAKADKPERGPRLDSRTLEKIIEERRRRAQGNADQKQDQQSDTAKLSTLKVRVYKRVHKITVDGKRLKGKRAKLTANGDHRFKVRVYNRNRMGEMDSRRKTILVKAGESQTLNVGR